MGCEYIETKLERHGTNPIKELRLLATYKKIMRDVMPDVVLSYTIKPNVYGGMSAQSFGIPYIANITGLGTAVERKSLMQIISIILYKLAFRRVHKVFLQNTENQQFFVNHKIALKRHRLVPGSGVNIKHFTVLEYPPDDTVEFVFISRIMEEKGNEQYLEAANLIKGQHPNTVFHVCGFCEGMYEERLRALEKKGIVKYHGMLRDIREILKRTHCTVHPTYYPEGLSNVLLESAACARPIITTNRSGCREVIDDGVNGYVVAERDSLDLVEKLDIFLGLSYTSKKKMGLASREKVVRKFDRQLVVKAYLEEIENVIDQ